MKLVRWFKYFIAILLVLWSMALVYFWLYSVGDYSNSSVDAIRNRLVDLEIKCKDLVDTVDSLRSVKDFINTNNVKHYWPNFTSSCDSIDRTEEMLRRRSQINLRELLYTVEAQSSNLNGVFVKDMKERIFSLIADMELMADIDSKSSWRRKELYILSQIVRSRIELIQNPSNCDLSRKIICNLNKGCGFGCQIHHVLYCLILAYSTERTLILEAANWRYGAKGWEFVFQPLSKSCTRCDKTKATVSWGDPRMHDFVNINVPIIDTLNPKPPYLPQAIPSDLYHRLETLHSDPFVWFAGQLLSYIMRLSPEMEKVLRQSNQAKFSQLQYMGPIVGVHIRRTDKVGTEAQFHDLSEYMKHVEAYFQKEEIKMNLKSQLPSFLKYPVTLDHKLIKLKRQIVLATDEPRIFQEIRDKYPQYEVIGNSQNSETANVGRRYTSDALQAIIIDTMFLSRTSFLVCTFSSQVCRVAYELMQTESNNDNGNQFRSLDDVYYFGGQQGNRMIMIQNYHGDINANVGDVVHIMGNHWNGWSKGSFGFQTGLFPTYKAQFIHISEKMGNYNFSVQP